MVGPQIHHRVERYQKVCVGSILQRSDSWLSVGLANPNENHIKTYAHWWFSVEVALVQILGLHRVSQTLLKTISKPMHIDRFQLKLLLGPILGCSLVFSVKAPNPITVQNVAKSYALVTFYAVLGTQNHHCVKRYWKVCFGNVLRRDWFPDPSLRKTLPKALLW